MDKIYNINNIEEAKISKSFQAIQNHETKKFIIKIPKIDDKYLDDTSKVLNYKGEPAGINRGILFRNGVDKTDQLVEADGQGIMIINNVTDEEAKILTEAKKTLSEVEPKFFVAAFKEFVEFANDIGLIDKYNSNISYMEKRLIRDERTGTYFGNNEIKNCYIAKENMIIEGAEGTIVNGSQGHPVNIGDIIVKTEDGGLRKIDREVFKETYLKANGTRLDEVFLRNVESLEDWMLKKEFDLNNKDMSHLFDDGWDERSLENSKDMSHIINKALGEPREVEREEISDDMSELSR